MKEVAARGGTVTGIRGGSQQGGNKAREREKHK